MNKLTGWIKQHQVATFFVITFATAFGIMVPGIIVFSGDQFLNQIIQFHMARLGVFGPVLAGMIITKLVIPGHRKGSRRARWIVFFPTWILAWSVSVLYIQHTTPSDNLPIIILVTGPVALLPAFVISGAFSRIEGIRSYLSTLVRPRGNLVWYLVALFTFPAIHILGNAITRILGGGSSEANSGVGADLVILTIITFLHVLLYTGGINEESGWRGFALPRLQVRYSPLVASLVIWFFHAIWELPGDVFFSGSSSWPAMSRLVWMPCWTVLFAWVYNRTEGSILAPALFHASMNAMNPLMDVLPTTDAGTVLLISAALFAIMYDRMWERLPAYDPAVYPAAEQAA